MTRKLRSSMEYADKMAERGIGILDVPIPPVRAIGRFEHPMAAVVHYTNLSSTDLVVYPYYPGRRVFVYIKESFYDSRITDIYGKTILHPKRREILHSVRNLHAGVQWSDVKEVVIEGVLMPVGTMGDFPFHYQYINTVDPEHLKYIKVSGTPYTTDVEIAPIGEYGMLFERFKETYKRKPLNEVISVYGENNYKVFASLLNKVADVSTISFLVKQLDNMMSGKPRLEAVRTIRYTMHTGKHILIQKASSSIYGLEGADYVKIRVTERNTAEVVRDILKYMASLLGSPKGSAGIVIMPDVYPSQANQDLMPVASRMKVRSTPYMLLIYGSDYTQLHEQKIDLNEFNPKADCEILHTVSSRCHDYLTQLALIQLDSSYGNQKDTRITYRNCLNMFNIQRQGLTRVSDIHYY